jgi:UDP-GlcNAc:undecaprenyl-phosphate/decaprenyl-phosphate GlcNAc-1-phosphate transferase
VLGFSVAFLGLDFVVTKDASNASSVLAFPLLVAALPLFDAILAILRRLESGRSPFHGDRRHFYDLLRAAGWTPKRVAVTCYLLTALLAGLGWLATTGNFKQTMIIRIGAAAALLWAALWLGSLRSRAPEPPSHRASV